MAKNLHASKKGTVIAIVGGDSLLGKEIRELLETASPPAELKLIGTGDDSAVLTEAGGEPALMTKLSASELADAKLVLLAGPPESSRQAFELAQKQNSKPVIVDATAELEENPLARLRAPHVQKSPPDPAPVQVVAHPAAIALALFIRELQPLGPIRRWFAHVFEPASERGQRGLDELQQQTVGLLSFQKLKKKVFDAQVSFNLLPEYGEDAPRSLQEIELTIDRHLASLLATAVSGVPMPSIRVIQAPVFHGYSFSIWVEFERNPGVAAITAALKAASVDVRSPDEEAPNNAGVAGQSGITVGVISVDRNDARACWFWMVVDNLRMSAENAVGVAREFFK